MDLIPVTLRVDGRAAGCLLRSGKVAAHVALAEPTDAADGLLGIRPSQVQWTPRPGGGDARWLQAVVREVDAMGEDVLIYAQLTGEPITILERGGRTAEVGQEIGVALPPEALHLFAGERRVALRLDAAGARTMIGTQQSVPG